MTLSVTDDDGSTDKDTARIEVRNVAPSASAVDDVVTYLAPEGGLLLNFRFSDPGRKDTHRIVVFWGDGSRSDGRVTEWQNGKGTGDGNHRYTETGTYQAELRVIDDDGGTGVTSFTVEVRAP